METVLNLIRREFVTNGALGSKAALFFREPEDEVIPTLEELGIGFVPFSPLGKGFLTGNINDQTAFDPTDFRNKLPRFSEETVRPISHLWIW